MAGWLACATSTDLIIQVMEGSHVDHLPLMFSHKFINTVYIRCLKTLIQMLQTSFQLSWLFLRQSAGILIQSPRIFLS